MVNGSDDTTYLHNHIDNTHHRKGGSGHDKNHASSVSVHKFVLECVFFFFFNFTVIFIMCIKLRNIVVVLKHLVEIIL